MNNRKSNIKKVNQTRTRADNKAVICLILGILIFGVFLFNAINQEIKRINKLDTAVASNPIDYSSGGFNLGNVTEYAVQKDIDDAIATRQKYEPIFDRIYGNGYYQKDFYLTQNLLNRLIEQRYEEKLSQAMRVKVIVKSSLVFYKNSLEELENGKLMYQTVMCDLSSYVYKGQFEIYYFTDQCLDNTFLLAATNYMRDKTNIASMMKRNDVIDLVFAFTEETLAYYTEEQIRKKDYAFTELIKLQPEYAQGDYSHFIYEPNFFSEKIKKLSEMYNQEFYVVNVDEYGYFPLESPELHFIDEEMYLAILAQKYMGNLAYSIIDELGASDKIVQFSRIDDNLSNLSHMSEIEYRNPVSDPEEFLGAIYNDTTYHNADDIEILFIYLLSPDEKIDYELALNTLENMYKALPTKRKDEFDYTLYMEFYEIDTESKSIAVDLFRRNLTPMIKYEHDDDLAAGLGKMDDIDYDTEGFRFLDTYGIKLNYWTNACSDMSKWSQIEFEKKCFEKIIKNGGKYLWN